MEKYNNYLFDDFLNDDSFLNHVKNNSAQPNSWQRWAENRPPNYKEYLDARSYLITIANLLPVNPPAGLAGDIFADIQASITVQEKRAAKIRLLRTSISTVAASIGLSVLGLWYYTSKVSVTTSYGQQQVINLPDNTVVTLNANSSIAYYRAWGWHSPREVWLKGEALFKVVHLNHAPQTVKPAETFITHSGNVNIQVLGTTFNVKERRGQVTVALIEGKVKVTNYNNTITPVLIHPGEALNYQQGKIQITRLTNLTNKPVAWTGSKIIASGMTVADIISSYEDTYGGTIVLEDQRLAAKKIDGTISLRNKESTLYMLANLLNARIDQRRDTVYLKIK